MAVTISILICTRNRADDLRATLASIVGLSVPADLPTEVVVIDNGSTDHTREVVEHHRSSALPIRRIHEPRAGKGHAYNAGMQAAGGRVFLFTDDDVRVPRDWIEGMCRPIVNGTADAVAGGVRLAPHLLRPWMTPVHRAWLASTEYLTPDAPEEMVGANMAFGRHVLSRVPAFDIELGPGALGFSDESLFSWQLVRAGYRIAPAFEVMAEHHFDPRRLLRASFARMARSRGRCLAYLKHHWHHEPLPHARRQWMAAVGRLCAARAAHLPAIMRPEGMPVWEMYQLERAQMLRSWPRESARVRHYERFGLVKRVGAGAVG